MRCLVLLVLWGMEWTCRDAFAFLLWNGADHDLIWLYFQYTFVNDNTDKTLFTWILL